MRKKLFSLKLNIFVVIFLLLGLVFKLFVTSNGMIIFHMDSARDYVDVREMVELMKPRLIGQTSGIEGLYNGPGWYYLLAIPYIIFDGDPYGGVVLMIVLWAIGGYFLYLITRKYGMLAWLGSLFVWFASPYISLSTVYSFNPHPLIYLTPVCIYLLEKYIVSEKIWYGLGAAFLSALFFQWEMNTGVFMPPIIVLLILFAGKFELFKTKNFWFIVAFYLTSFLPQLLFDFKHEHIMFNAIMRFLGEGGAGQSIFSDKFATTWNVFFGAFTPTLLNSALLVKSILVLFLIISLFALAFKKRDLFKDIDITLTSALLLIIVPFIGYLVLPVNIHPWHMVSVVPAFIIIVAFVIKSLKKNFPIGWGLIFIFFIYCFTSTWNVLGNGISEHGIQSTDPSNLANELKAVDYAYEQAQGQNFKAYAYLPSVLDYPYQYLFWWHGMKKYGYTPFDYAYLPDKPAYISNKQSFVKPKEGAQDSGLTILIKEPDRIKMRRAWEDDFDSLAIIDHRIIAENPNGVGPLEAETRKATESGIINSVP